MKRAVIFDFGGVLMKTVDYAPRHAWDDRLGLPRGSVERIVHNPESWVQAQHGAISIESYWADVAEQLGLSPQDTRQLATDFYSGDQLDANLMAYIGDLRRRKHPVALLSNDSLELVDRLETLGIASSFSPIVISARIGVMKPAAAAYQTVLDRLNRPPSAAVLIDDRPENIAGARGVGIHAVHYSAGMDLPAIVDPLLDAKSA
jgi:HAD superfamily hydrolase (TIGR01509 family)